MKTKTSSKRNAAARSSLARGSMLREEHARQCERNNMREWLLGLRFRLVQQLDDVDSKLATLKADIEQAKQMAASSNTPAHPRE